jgi:hypothetical protein
MSPFGTAVPADNSDIIRQREKIENTPMPDPIPGESEAEYIRRCDAERLKREELLSILVEEARRRAEIRHPITQLPHQGVTYGDLPAPPGVPSFDKITIMDVGEAQRSFDDMSPFGEDVPADDSDIDAQRQRILSAPPPARLEGESTEHFLLRCENSKLQREEALSILEEEQRRRVELRQPLDADLAAAQQKVLNRPPEGAAAAKKKQNDLLAIRHAAEHRQEARIIDIQAEAQRDAAFTALENAEWSREQEQAVPIGPAGDDSNNDDDDDEAEIQRRVAAIREQDMAEDEKRRQLEAEARQDALNRQAADAAAALQSSINQPYAPLEDQGVIAKSIAAMKQHVSALEAKIRAVNDGPLQDADSSDSDALFE